MNNGQQFALMSMAASSLSEDEIISRLGASAREYQMLKTEDNKKILFGYCFLLILKSSASNENKDPMEMIQDYNAMMEKIDRLTPSKQ